MNYTRGALYVHSDLPVDRKGSAGRSCDIPPPPKKKNYHPNGMYHLIDGNSLSDFDNLYQDFALL